MDKNPWKGLKCGSCDQIFNDEYFKDPLYSMNSCHMTLAEARIWFCGKCNELQQEKYKQEAKEAAKINGGTFGRVLG